MLLTIVFAAVLALVVHEYAHLTVALIMGVPVKQLGWRSFHGPYLRRQLAPYFWQEMTITLAGPIANLILAWMIWPIPYHWSFNLVLALTNLIPFLPRSDGQRAWRMIVARRRMIVRLNEIAKTRGFRAVPGHNSKTR